MLYCGYGIHRRTKYNMEKMEMTRFEEMRAEYRRLVDDQNISPLLFGDDISDCIESAKEHYRNHYKDDYKGGYIRIDCIFKPTPAFYAFDQALQHGWTVGYTQAKEIEHWFIFQTGNCDFVPVKAGNREDAQILALETSYRMVELDDLDEDCFARLIAEEDLSVMTEKNRRKLGRTFAGIDLTDEEKESLSWLAGRETDTVNRICDLVSRKVRFEQKKCTNNRTEK